MQRNEDRNLPARSWRRPPPAVPGSGSFLVVDERDGSEPIHVASMLRRQKWIILAATVVVLAATAAFTYTRPEVFESGATFLVVSPGGDDRSKRPGARDPVHVLGIACPASSAVH